MQIYKNYVSTQNYFQKKIGGNDPANSLSKTFEISA